MNRMKRLVRSPRLSRREALNLLGLGGLGLISTHGSSSVLAANWQAAGARAGGVVFPKGAVIRALLKDIPPETLTNGATLFHEHFSIALPPVTPRPPDAPPPLPNPTQDLNLMIEEAKAAAKDGVACIVDGGHADMGRDQLLICSDFTGRRSAARPGYGNTVTVFAPKLRQAGVKEETVHAILYDNPRRFLAFVPKAM